MNPEPSYYVRLFRHNAWANAESLGSLRNGSPPAKALRWMAHLIGSEYLWLARLRHEPPELEVWPELDLEACAARLEILLPAWEGYLEALTPEDLEDGIAYRNTKGEFWTSRVADILTHVALHQSYHRGQIAAAVREAGATPAYTDFIHAVRQGLVE
jgi:uncharacterized damage-inducible protein DinB